ncbi:zinc finger BED domain-containing protein RICESLEEPER 2-like [Rutidosis leptorrhynchoides]|uniref:zinc finger BED domain-containing protein RICESLEEPER 2-like n=1 Tax=Rutidosis leptorrhynchoides TaxID=125765 RepID=UPI003A99DF01
MRRCAHILNLVVTSGLKDYAKSIKVIRNAVKYVRSSPSRLNKFKQCIEDEKISMGGSVCLEVPTRWNSTFLMLESAIKYRKAFERMEDDSQYFGYFILDSSLGDEEANQNESRIGPPCSRDWDEAEKFMMFLELFFVVTKRFSGSLYVTSNMYFHDLCTIYTHITSCIEDDDPKLSHMACDMKLKFDKYWGELGKVNPLLFVAVVLDPRYKKQYVDWSFDEIYGINDVSNKMKKKSCDLLNGEMMKSNTSDPKVKLPK